MSEPMSEERLVEVRQYAHAIREKMQGSEGAPTELVWAGICIMELLAEVERLRAEVAAMRPIVEAVAKLDGEMHGSVVVCQWCNAYTTSLKDIPVKHEPDCLVTQA